MFKKKYIIVLLLLIVGIFAISSVSANDNVTDVAAADEASDDLVNNVEEDVSAATVDEVNPEEISADENEPKLEKSINGSDLIGYYDSPSYDEYDVWIDDTTIRNWQQEAIIIHINPAYSSYYKYDFYLRFYDSNDEYVYGEEIYSSTAYSTIVYNIPAYNLSPDTYTIQIVNYDDDYLMDEALLTVSDEPYYADISAWDYNAFYNSGATFNVRLTERGTGKALSGMSIRIAFSNGVVRYYNTDSNGWIRIVPPVGVGSYAVSISSNNGHVIASAVTKSAVIKKSTVSIKAYKAVTYKGFKLCLKVTVKSQGRNVNEGTVKFKINGKTYYAPVVNGVAVKYVKLNKIKKYKYTATFSSSNFYGKSAKAKAEVKKRYKTKIIGKKSIKGNMYKNKKITFKIRTKSGGKKVKGGYLLVYDKTHGYLYWHKVKGGKASHTFTFNGNLNYYGYYSGVYQYSKKAVTKYKIYYVPSTLKYKGSHIKFKKVSKYKCSTCGKKKSHTHGGGWFTTYIYVN